MKKSHPSRLQHLVRSGRWLAWLVFLPLASNLPAGNPPPVNKLTLVEAYADKLVCVTAGGDVSCDTTFSDTYTISATISGVFTGLTAGTSFELICNDLDVMYVLGDDAKFTPVKSTSATFIDTESDANGRTVVAQTVKLKWTPKQLTITLTGKATADYGNPAAAGNYVGNVSGKVSDVLAVSLNFSDTTITFDNITLTGTVKTKTVAAKDGSAYDLSTIAIKGSGTGTVAQ